MKGKRGEDRHTLARSLRIQGEGEGRPGGQEQAEGRGLKAAMVVFFFLGCLFDVA